MSELCKGRVVLITGAGHGLGRAHALACAQAGAQVVVNDLGVSREGEAGDTTAAQKVVDEIAALGGQAVANGDDVSDWDGAARMVHQAVEHFGRLDAVVNNAGFVRDRMFVNATPEEWDAVVRVHLRGHFCVGRHAAAYWRGEAKAGNTPQARLINTTSGAGLLGSVGQAAYSAAKGGIAALTLVQAAELGSYGITANALAPSARTRMTEPVFGDQMQKPQTGFDPHDPANVSPLVVWLASADSQKITGCVFEISGGQLSLADGWRTGPLLDKERALAPEDIAEMVEALVRRATPPQPVYGARS